MHRKKDIFWLSMSTYFVFSSIACAESMCRANEDSIFSCKLGESTASLCKRTGSGALTYRRQKANKIDLEVSDAGKKTQPVFYFSYVPYGGGGEAHVRFAIGSYTYFLYDKTVRSDSGPEFSSGIVVHRNNKKISESTCDNDASIKQYAYSEMRKEEYRDIGSK